MRERKTTGQCQHGNSVVVILKVKLVWRFRILNLGRERSCIQFGKFLIRLVEMFHSHWNCRSRAWEIARVEELAERVEEERKLRP